MTTTTAVELGKRYRDEPTGYEGVATARTEYVSGRVNVCLERLKTDGTPEETWWHEPRLREVTDAPSPGFGSRS